MLYKEPKNKGKLGKQILISAIAIEAFCFIGSYYIWNKTNRDRDFRNSLRLNYPSILEIYYKTNEYFNPNNKIREVDKTYWKQEGLGYVLYLLAKQSEEQIKKNQVNYPGSEKDPKEVYNKKQQFIDILQAASNSDKPLYRLTKEEIEKDIIKTKK